MIDQMHLAVKKFILIVFRPLVWFFTHFKISPNSISAIGFLINIAALLVLSQGYFVIGGLVILLAGLFDMLDGHIARNQNKETKFGALLDSTLDRYSELLLFLGISIFLVRDILHNGTYYTKQLEIFGLLGIFFMISGSLMVSYVRARAEGLGLSCKVGLIQRPERVVGLAIGCFLPYPWILYMIFFLAFTTNLTVLQRIIHVYQTSRTK